MGIVYLRSISIAEAIKAFPTKVTTQSHLEAWKTSMKSASSGIVGTSQYSTLLFLHLAMVKKWLVPHKDQEVSNKGVQGLMGMSKPVLASTTRMPCRK